VHPGARGYRGRTHARAAQAAGRADRPLARAARVNSGGDPAHPVDRGRSPPRRIGDRISRRGGASRLHPPPPPRPAGHAPARAPTGRAGLDRIGREPYDAVVLDLMLPDVDGLEVCRQLRATSSELPVLMLTARGDTMDRVVGLEIGADDYMAKPFEPRELLA